MKIVTYNVNGIRAAMKKDFVQWIIDVDADIICLQETKAQDDQLPIDEFEALGYTTFHHAAEKKGYSGVAILTRIKPDRVIIGMDLSIYDREGRFLRADFGDLSVVSVYHPSGSSGDERQVFKMQWLSDFQMYIDHLKKERPNLILCGDFNICHKPIDIHDPKGNAKNSGFLPEERDWIDGFMKSGFVDSFRILNPQPNEYSWWTYRFNARANNKGWRIDYILVSDTIGNKITKSFMMQNAHHSDHCPVVTEMLP